MKFFAACTLGLSLLFASLPAMANQIHVYAASSMTNVIDELAQIFTKQTGVKVVPIYAGSSTLARQIEQGAPADIFISANPQWMDYLLSKNLVSSDGVTSLLSNDLVLISTLANQQSNLSAQQLDTLPQLLGDERIALGMTDSVPAGIYAKQSFETLGIWPQLMHKTAPTNNVRLVLALVERGEAPFGVVYKTDAMMSSKVTISATLAAHRHEPIMYPMALLTQDIDSKAFVEFLTSDQAIKVFTQYGFRPLNHAD